MSIIGTMTAAISGMRVQSVRANVAANNIANAQTPGYQALQVGTSTLSTKQVSATTYSPGGVFANVSPSVVENAGVDLAQEITNLILAEISYKANATVIRRTEELARSVVDLKA